LGVVNQPVAAARVAAVMGADLVASVAARAAPDGVIRAPTRMTGTAD
jgi:hypothetical protein